jgi:hypothetical protein
MEKLKNGATLIHRTPVRDINIVFARQGEGAYDPWVTWIESPTDGNCINGNYHHDFFAAVDEYRQRIQRQGGFIG